MADDTKDRAGMLALADRPPSCLSWTVHEGQALPASGGGDLLSRIRDYLVANMQPGNDLAPKYIQEIDAVLQAKIGTAPQPGDGSRESAVAMTERHTKLVSRLRDIVRYKWAINNISAVEEAATEIERFSAALSQQPACVTARECDCGFSAEVCRTNHCYRKQIATSGLVPDAKWPNTGRAALQQPDAAGDGENSDGRTDEAKARDVSAASGSAALNPVKTHEDHGSANEAGLGSERSSPSEAAEPFGYVVLNRHGEPTFFNPRDKAKANKAFMDYGSRLVPVYERASRSDGT